MAKIVWTLEAAHCLEAIHEYISLSNKSAAYRTVVGIHKKIRLLRAHPRLGQRYEPVAEREVREILYGHYRIAYCVVSDTRIEILGIFHGAMDIDQYLK